MRVTKRSGNIEDVSFDKVLRRIKNLSDGLNVDIYDIAQKVCGRIYDLVKTSELDELTAQLCGSMIVEHPDYNTLAARISVSNHHKNTSPSFSETIEILNQYSLISSEVYTIVNENKEILNSYIDYQRDYLFDYFGFKTLEKSYLLKANNKIIERPQHLLMRVSLGIHGFDIEDALQTYDCMSNKYFIHATPTLFNAGTPRPQMSSCFLLALNEDSIDGIFQSVKECAEISKNSGGIGLHIHNIRSKNSLIRGTHGKSDGIVPFLRVFNATARAVNQCFTGDTMIYTEEEVKKISDINPNDKVLTSDGSFRRVREIIINKVDKVINSVTIDLCIYPVKVTKEHQIYLIKNQYQYDLFTIKELLNKGKIRAEFTNSISPGDLVGYPIYYLREKPGFMSEDYYFYGLMLSSGTIRKDSFTQHYSIKISTLQPEAIDFVKSYLRDKEVIYSSFKDNDIEFISWTKASFWLKYDMLYLDGKKILDSQFMNCESTLDGFLVNLHCHLASKTYYYFTTSESLVYSIRFMFLGLGVLIDVFKSSEREYGLAINFTKNTFFVYEGIVWTKVTSVEEQRYSGKVYDLNIEDNHNYTVADLGLVHNSGKRNGSFAIYLEPHHADIEAFLDLRKNHGNEEERCRDLFTALWIPDLFMKRVEENGIWSLMCPDTCKGLSDVYGDEFDALYTDYENRKMYKKQIKAQDLWFKILQSQIETGTPYILYKDAVNKKTNQQNIGTIKSSNLCVAPETMILTDKGYFPIKDLHNQQVNVWNGTEFSETVVHQTGKMQRLIKVSFSNGMSIRCTPYHKFHVEEGIVRAENLQLGMRIISYHTPVINLNEGILPYAYTQGLFAAIGDSNTNSILLYGEKRKLLCYVDWLYFNEGNSSINIILPRIKNKYYVPINNSIKSKIRWLEGFLDGSGYIAEGSIYVSSSNHRFLVEIVLMLQTLGIRSCISKRELYIESVSSLTSLGFRPNQFRFTDTFTPFHSVCVSGIDDLEEYDDTYCFNERKKHLGIFNGILTGNCVEIMEYSSPSEIAVCNLASLCIPSYIEGGVFNYRTLHDNVKIVVKNLNKIIDRNYYPLEKAKVSNLKHRPIGIGISGLADAFAMQKIPFESKEAADMNRQIFETIYHAALEESCNLARIHGAYTTFEGSPASKGILQFDMWGVTPSFFDWDTLKEQIKRDGIRNSLLVAPMPTASTSQIMGVTESFEPCTSNLFKRKTLSGEFIIINKILVQELFKIGLWTKDIRNQIILHEGSIQNITAIPKHIRDVFKTVWEIKQRCLIDLSADRGPYICQSQSLNVFMEEPDFKKLTSMHFYGWRKGLKSGQYYLRTKPKTQTQKFTLDPTLTKVKMECTDEVCTMCSS
jgi:ribonucleoside-diphosphate reductase alpha chain